MPAKTPWWAPAPSPPSARPGCRELGLALLVAVALFQSLRAVAAGRLLRLACQDPANFDTFFQVAWNFQDSGVFRQTVHAGYADSWVWGGHLSLTFPLASLLLGLHPTPGFLQGLQLAAVSSAVVAGFLLGRAEARDAAGGVLGVLAVVGSPALLVVALADYQDLVLCIPAALWATVFIRRGWLVPSLLACAAMAACREECVLLVPLLAAAVPGPWRRRLLWALCGGLVAGTVLGVEIWLSLGVDRYPNPLAVVGPGSLQSLVGKLQLRGWMAQNLRTYWLLLEPLGLLLLLSPLHLLGVLSVLAVHAGDFFHASDWYSPLVHHFAPAVAMAIAGVVIGGAVPLRWLLARGRWGRALAWGALAAVLAVSAWRVAGWHVFRGAAWHAPLTAQPSAAVVPHPAWELARDLPPEAAVVARTRLMMAIAARRWAYDFEDSLASKTGGLGLACVHFALVAEDDEPFQRAIRDVPDVRVLRRLEGFDLVSLRPLDRPLPGACHGGGR
ncbi:MAG: DUF2079 domain-containing protein [Pseudomonadota bacterium]